MGYRIKDTTSDTDHPWSRIVFHTFEAAAKHAAYLNNEEETRGSIQPG
jgi:hypothetical protein